MANWSYEQTFDGLTLGDLNGQDSWSGSTAWDVQNSIVIQGTQAIRATSPGTVQSITRVLPATVDGGSVAFYMRVTDSDVSLFHGACKITDLAETAFARFRFQDDKLFVDNYLTNEVATLLNPFLVDTWYLITVEFVNNTFRAKVDTDAFTSFFDISASGAVLADRIVFQADQTTAESTFADDIHIPATPPATAGAKLFNLMGVGK